MNELESLEEFEKGGVQNSNLNLSNVYSVKRGGFGFESGISTYLTTLRVSELENDITFYEKLSSEKDWPISQIIQREVDLDRVNSITNKYLLGRGRLVKYFPPIIVAFIPKDENGGFSKQMNFASDETVSSKELIFDKSKYRNNPKFKELILGKQNESNVDGLYIVNTSPIFEHTLLCWDKSKFHAIVIDGQHRMNALIKGGKENPDYINALQDVIFLDVSDLIKNHEQYSPVEIFRTVFIDINTNAKSVGLVRRILMDDKDLASLCVQSLVESVNKDGSSKRVGTYIPSVLVDWHGESLKHELPHITGVLSLYQIISDELAINRLVSIDDHRDQKKIKYFIDLLNNYFFVDTLISKKREYKDITPLEKSFNEYLDYKKINKEIFSEQFNDEGLDSILFSYDYRVLEIAQDVFEQFYSEAIVKVFLEFVPYTKAIEVLSSLEAFNSETNLYRALISSRNKILRNAVLRDNFIQARQKLNETVDKNYFLFYTVVGQKAIFKGFFERVLVDYKYGITNDSIIEVQVGYLSKINEAVQLLDSAELYLFAEEETDLTDVMEDRLLEFGTMASSFWEGILLEEGRIIYNSQGVKVFSDVLNFIVKCVDFAKKGSDKNELYSYNFRFANSRTKRLLKKRFANRAEEEYDEISSVILERKRYLIESIYKQIS